LNNGYCGTWYWSLTPFLEDKWNKDYLVELDVKLDTLINGIMNLKSNHDCLDQSTYANADMNSRRTFEIYDDNLVDLMRRLAIWILTFGEPQRLRHDSRSNNKEICKPHLRIIEVSDTLIWNSCLV
jgi:hypothetical protein